MTEKDKNIIQSYLDDRISKKDFATLQSLLRTDEEARNYLLDIGTIDSKLEQLAGARQPETIKLPKTRKPSWLAVAAMAAIVTLLVWPQITKPKIVATISSVEDAAWQSSLPTEVGSKLTRGYLTLTSGLATIRFRSGAEITLEAPAKLVLKTSMKAELISGVGVIDVPDSAIGFVLETPNGYAVDYGTRFTVDVDGHANRTDFEVLSGEISVHHPDSDSKVHLTDRQTTALTEKGLQSIDNALPEKKLKKTNQSIRIVTNGHSTSVIRNDEREEYLNPELLMVKRSKKSFEFDRRALFSFDISKIDFSAVDSARIRLNLVPSGIGFRSHLPVNNRFSIYGIPNTWDTNITWEASPKPENGVFLGSFEIPRSRETGTFGIQTPQLLEFLVNNSSNTASFLVLRETTEVEGKGMAHAFASDIHPEASGPILELQKQ